MSRAECDPLVGALLGGRLEMLLPIGGGPRSRLYRAIQRPLGREVVVKVLDPRSRDPGAQERLFLTALLTAKLRHPSTQVVYDCGLTDDGRCFVALEPLEGQTLEQVLAARGRLPWPQALGLLAQVARSLREAHALGLVHGSLSPSSIALVPDGSLGPQVKVLDYGLTKQPVGPRRLPVEPEEWTPGARDAVVPGAVAGLLSMGPLPYQAPELARGEYEPRSDIYSWGAVAFRAIAGRPLFSGETSIELISQHLHTPAPGLEQLAEVPEYVAALVARCLEKSPEARWRDIDELLEALGPLADPVGVLATPSDDEEGHVDGRADESLAAEGARATRPPQAPLERVRAPSAKAPPSARTLPRVSHLGRPHRSGGRRAILWAVACGLATSALAAVAVVSSGGWRLAERPGQASEEVVFEVLSEPPGATVVRGIERLGVTPLTLTLPRLPGQSQRVCLSFLLDGYETTVLVAEAEEGVVLVHAAMVPHAETVPVAGVEPRARTRRTKSAPTRMLAR